MLESLAAVLLAGSSAAATQAPQPVQSGPQEPHERFGDSLLPPARRGTTPAPRFESAGVVTVQVNVDAQGRNMLGDAANEPSIAIDPTQPSRMVIGWRQFDDTASNFRQAGYAYSHDSGASWKFPGVLTPGVFRSDPVLACDGEGRFWYYSLSTPGGEYLCDLFESTDGGVTWSDPKPTYGGDKPWYTVAKEGGPFDGVQYATWSWWAACCGFDTAARSDPSGEHWQRPSRVKRAPIWGTLATAADGTLFLSGMDQVTFTSEYGSPVVARSTAAGDPLAPFKFEQSVVVDLGGELIYQFECNPEGLAGQIWVATDAADPQIVYLLSSVDPPGPDPLDVRFSRSTDRGTTWSESRRLNDDAPDSAAWQWFGTMSVAPNGRIDVVWNDTRALGQANWCELYYTKSYDKGLTWSTNRSIGPPWNSHLGWPNQQKIGDYYHMLSDDEAAHLAWSATFNGEQDVYYTRIPD